MAFYGGMVWKTWGLFFFTSVELNIFEFFFFLSCSVMVLIVSSQISMENAVWGTTIVDSLICLQLILSIEKTE